jgi:uncharacterized repeat protein (TIGR03803 family)
MKTGKGLIEIGPRTRSTSHLTAVAFGLMLSANVVAQTYKVLHHFEPAPPVFPHGGLVADSAGNFYGTTAEGGANNLGTIFKLDPSGGLTLLHSFSGGEDGAKPNATLIRDSSGNIYGTTTAGAANDSGTVFLFDASGRLTTLYQFDWFNGASPFGALILDGSGNLYGTTVDGGAGGVGTVFRLNGLNNVTSLHSFSTSDSNGFWPRAGLVRSASGDLYGATSAGGASDMGTVFKLDASGVLTVLHNFSGSDGEYPHAALIQDGSGNFYGTTTGGGANGFGTVFKLDGSGTLTILHSFDDSDGASPASALIRDNSGNFFGTTFDGGANGLGTVFRLDSSGTLTPLHSFDGGDGANPDAVLFQDGSGDLYGTTVNGGPSGWGTLFRLDASGTLTTLHTFNYTNGANPYAALIQDGSGNLYGTTVNGGVGGYGSVFRLDASGTLSTLHPFANSDGAHPYAALIRDGSGNLYGTTFGVSLADIGGTVYKLDDSGTLTTLHAFGGFDGDNPYGALIQDGSGNLYGTTSEGGTGLAGTVFKLDPVGTLTTLHNFHSSDGGDLEAALTQDSSGNLYGTTLLGGTNFFAGTVFKLETTENLTTLHNFSESDGAKPGAALVRDASGNLYGSTVGGGAHGYGTVFMLDGSGLLTTLHSFTFLDGAYPHDLMRDSSGNLYGTTYDGGAHGSGTIFKLDPSGTLTTLHSFNDAGGSHPVAGLIQDSSDNLYGTTYDGGSGGTGVVFLFNTTTSPLTVSAIAPSSGPSSGGTTVSVTGAGFLEGASLTIGAVEAVGVVAVDSTEIKASTPALLPGTLNDVTVTNPGSSPGTSGTLTAAFFADFLDVSASDIFHHYVEEIVRNGITAGCGGGYYCRDNPALRKQMAVFVLKAKEGASYTPPAAVGIFTDVPVSDPFAPWIEELYKRGVVAGCGQGPAYCPDGAVLRQQMAVFLLKTLLGSSYVPPGCAGIFPDVPCSNPFAPWIEDLFNRGIAAGCGNGSYCPYNPTTRGQMAVFLVKTFALP